ncbi:SRPBCC family protein [Actinoplanes sp. NBRC 101535]|uniref:type II toxin-antitoxin system Rv0910 family toxin n=1 Tax=Actinoplanes sp. NBRC 101535 TaxID=3032196 RepID=UPI00255532AD|nr:SRPBCC family protein [Actinoplanes sp. NBRC 101535]
MPTPLRAVFAMARAVAASVVSRVLSPRREPPTTPPAGGPRVYAYPCDVRQEVGAPPGRVFAQIADPGRRGSWLTSHLGWVGETPTGFRDGERVVERVKLMGTPAEVRWTIVRAEAPRCLWLEGRGPMGISVGFALTVEPSGSGTTVRFDGGVEGGTADGPLGPMVARNLGDAVRVSLKRLAGGARREPERAAGRDRERAAKPGPVRHQRTGQDLDAWTPVIVGVGQVSDHGTEPRDGDPVSLAARAARSAAADCGAGERIWAEVDLVGYVASVSWQYPDAAALLADRVGARPSETVQTTVFGGDGSLRLLNDAAAAIVDGRARVALLGGGEAAATAAAAERAGITLDWPRQDDDAVPGRTIGVDTAPNTDAEIEAGLVAPIHLYALIQSTLPGGAGELWSRFSRVAAGNPYAWRRESLTAAQVAAPGPGNRPIADPYPKLMTANLQVNQATGIILCSVAAATEAGIPQEKWVFPHVGAHATDEWYVTERSSLNESPAIRANGRAVLDHVARDIGQIRYVDLYACFPSAVQIGAAELGLPLDDPDRPLTVTGGLTMAGGPGNNYSSHAVATMVPLLRAAPDDHGLVTALGWYLTKHAITLLSATPPERPFADLDADAAASREKPRKVAEGYTGPATLEAFTTTYHRDATPEALIVTAITPSGDRVIRRVPPRPGPLTPGQILHITRDGFEEPRP